MRLLSPLQFADRVLRKLLRIYPSEPASQVSDARSMWTAPLFSPCAQFRAPVVGPHDADQKFPSDESRFPHPIATLWYRGFDREMLRAAGRFLLCDKDPPRS